MNGATARQGLAGLTRKRGAIGRSTEMALPRVWPFLVRWFTGYANRHLRRHFHSLRVSRAVEPPANADRPIVLFLNHASWWDPLVCMELKRQFFPERTGYAPIDAVILERYAFFKHLGFFAVHQQSNRGAREFLRVAEQLLRSPETLLVVTPQGRFADTRERPVSFANGLGHLAARAEHALFVPVALEYVYWTERFPEILVRFGESIDVATADSELDGRDWTALLEGKLEEAQDALAGEVLGRDERAFRILLRGNSGASAVYDAWRAMKAWSSGREFRKEHGR